MNQFFQKNVFKRKKRDLSNNSKEDDKSSKKQRQRSLNDSAILEKVDVFTEGLNSPECVFIQFNCLKTLKRKSELSEKLQNQHKIVK